MTSSDIPSDFDRGRFLGSFIDVAKAVLISPKVFFSTMDRQGAFANPVTFLASCVVQDGHGMLPMLAHSRKAFIFIKVVNLLTGLLVGGVALAAGF